MVVPGKLYLNGFDLALQDMAHMPFTALQGIVFFAAWCIPNYTVSLTLRPPSWFLRTPAPPRRTLPPHSDFYVSVILSVGSMEIWLRRTTPGNIAPGEEAQRKAI